MLQELGRDAYVRALTAHRQLLRAAFTSHGGVEVEMQGDSFHFAFPYARDAVAAAVAGQRALLAHEWESQPIAVRIGLHTGEPVQADGLYAGLDVHRAARVMSAGHGGQVLVSQQTAELVEGELAQGISLLDLGEHRLKDLSAPQRLYQAFTDDLPAAFPPLKTLVVQTNLPVAASPFIGREREVEEICELVQAGTRVVTVTGAGGTGKTRLALHAAAQLAERFPGGACWVPLAALTDATLVLPSILQALGAEEPLAAYLEEHPCLLLLDNFEHLLGAAGLLSTLLTAAPATRVLVTSRSPLRIDGEHEYRLEPLAEAEAVALFLERSRAGVPVAPGSPVAEICARLDNLPLAVELAAARTRVLSPEALLARLEQRLPLLTGGRRDAPQRQQTLRDTIAWSYDLLDGDLQMLFARLSVFAGEFSLEAGEVICQASLDGLQALVDASLLKPTGRGRFLMLETIHEYALQQLRQQPGLEELEQKRTDWFAARAYAQAGQARRSDPAALEFLQLEQQNLRAAFADAVHKQHADPAYKLLIGTWFFLSIRGRARELERWAQQVVALPPGEDERLRGEGLAMAAEAFRIRGDRALAAQYKREAMQLLRAAGQDPMVAACLADLAFMAAADSDWEVSEALANEALAIRERLGVETGIAHAKGALAEVAFGRGDYERAIELLEPHVETYRTIGAHSDEAAWLMSLGTCHRRLGSQTEAGRCFHDAIELASSIEDLSFVADMVIEIAGLALSHDTSAAAQLLGGAERLRDELGVPFYDQTDHDNTLRELESLLHPAELERLRHQGETLQREELLRRAQQIAGRVANSV